MEVFYMATSVLITLIICITLIILVTINTAADILKNEKGD